MKRFLLKSLVLLVAISALTYGSYRFNNYCIENTGFKPSDSTETLITGSSLISMGINPDSIQNAQNIALAAEPYVMSYLKLKEILKEKSNIKRVMLSFSLVEMINQDQSFNWSKSYNVEMFTRLLSMKQLISTDDLRAFDVDKATFYETLVRTRIFPNYAYISRYLKQGNDQYSTDGLIYIGKFARTGDFNIQSTKNILAKKERIRRYFPQSDFPAYLSEKNIAYLDSIHRLCSDADTELILVGMPFLKELHSYVPEYYLNYYSKLKNEIIDRGDIRFIDFNDVGDVSWFRDLRHLNDYGANRISAQLNDSLLATSNLH